MTNRVFAPGKVGTLATYLGYFFLRFPGTLSPEESWDLECFDTYDRRWTRQGRVWVRRGETWSLVEPPSVLSLGDSVSVFGLQKPLSLGKLTLKVRPVTFETGNPAIVGYVIRVRNRTFLALQGHEDESWNALVAALLTDGLEPVAPGNPDAGFVREKGTGFVPPATWPAGDPSESATTFLLDRLHDGWRMARQYEMGVQDDIDTECLHQYRVHLRRVRSLASLGRQWELLPEWNRLKTVLRTLQQKTNELRDLDVLLLDFPELQGRLPWDEGPRLLGWRDAVVQKRQHEFRRVKAWLGSDEHRQLAAEVDHLLDDLRPLGEPWTTGELAGFAFEKAARSLKKSLKAVGPDSPDSALHEVRIEAKKIRYALDSLGSFGPASAVKVLGTMLKEAQEGLGAFQDRCLLLERLRSEREGLPPGQPRFDLVTFGILIGVLTNDQDARRTLARRDCRHLQSRDFLRALGRLGTQRQETPDGP